MKTIILILFLTIQILPQSWLVNGIFDDAVSEVIDTTGNYLTTTHITRVEADGGTVSDSTGLNTFINQCNADTSFTKFTAVYDPNWGVKKNVNNKVTKLYNIKYSTDAPDLAEADTAKVPTLIPFLNNDGGATSYNSISLDGANDYLTTGLHAISLWQQPIHTIMAMRVLSTTANDLFWCAANFGSALQEYPTVGKLSFYAGSYIGNITIEVDSMIVTDCLGNGANSYIQIDDNAAVTGNAGVGGLNGLVLGIYNGDLTSYAANEEVGTIIVSSTLTSSEKAHIKTFLYTRWGVTP
jgi:hypothetical protein